MHPDLTKLLDLQDKDVALLEVDLRLKELLDGIAALDAEVTACRDEIDRLTSAVKEAVKRRVGIEGKVESLRVLQDRRRQRLEQARTARELQALGAELEMARSVLAKEEAEWFRAAEAVTALEAEMEAAKGRLEELEGNQLADREAAAEQVAAVEAEREAAAVERAEAAARLEQPLYIRYNRLRQARETRVVVALHGDACGACYTAIPMSRRSHVRAGTLLDVCEVCGVILYAGDQTG